MAKERRRYGVYDKDGVKLNTIWVDEPYPKDYWPGYGAYIAPEPGEPVTTPPEKLAIIEDQAKAFTFVNVRPKSRINTGDKLDMVRGDVIAKPIDEALAEAELPLEGGGK